MRPGSANLKKHKSRYDKSTERNRKSKNQIMNISQGKIIYQTN